MLSVTLTCPEGSTVTSGRDPCAGRTERKHGSPPTGWRQCCDPRTAGPQAEPPCGATAFLPGSRLPTLTAQRIHARELGGPSWPTVPAPREKGRGPRDRESVFPAAPSVPFTPLCGCELGAGESLSKRETGISRTMIECSGKSFSNIVISLFRHD